MKNAASKNWTMEDIESLVEDANPVVTLLEAGISRDVAIQIAAFALLATAPRDKQDEVAFVQSLVSAGIGLLALGLEIQKENQQGVAQLLTRVVERHPEDKWLAARVAELAQQNKERVEV